MISSISMLECQELIDKVRESRYLKVRARQISKFNILLQNKGNITWSSTPYPPQLGNNTGPASAPSQLGSNAGRAGSHFQALSVSPQAGSVSIPQPGRSTSSAGTQSQAGCISPRPGRNAVSAVTQSQAGSVSPQAGSVSPSARKECRQCKCSFPGRQCKPSAQE